MFDVTCLDSYGNVVTNLTQWDKNQSLKIINSGLTEAPQFHFCNEKSKEAYVVTSSISDGIITVEIPNDLLQEGMAIYAYIYAYESETSGKTLATIRIPVRPRPKPSDYVYVENVKYTLFVSFAEISINIDNDLNVISNNTYDEILQAYNDGKMFRINITGDIFDGWIGCAALKLNDSDRFEFYLNRDKSNILITCNSDNTWNAREANTSLETKENVSNKVNTISGTPSMDKYPSEVAVFEYGMRLQNSSYSYASGYTNQEISNLRTETDEKLEAKEDVSNKVKDMTTPEMTEEAYPTVYAVTSYVGDKTDYLAELANSAMQQANATAVEVGDNETGLDTKESLSNKVNDLNNFNPDNADNYYPSVSAFLNYVQMFATQETANAIISDVQNIRDMKESLSNKVITEDEVTETAPYFSAEATKEYVAEQLSELDKGVEFVDIYFTTRDGETNVECDKSPSEISNLIESGHNIKLKLNVTGMSSVDDIVFICELEQLREGIELYFVSMRSPDMYCDVTGDITTDRWSVFIHQSMYQEYVQNYVDEAIQSAIYDSWEEEV